MKTNSIILVLLLISTICYSQSEKWITDKNTGCKLIASINVDKRYIKWTGDCVGGYVSGNGTLLVYQSDTLYLSYNGTCQNGKINGNGTMIWPDGQKYIGEFKNGTPNGHGTMFYSQTSNPNFNGRKYIGEWKDGEQYGQGVETLGNGIKSVFSLIDGKRYYKLYLEDGKLYEEGYIDAINSSNYSNE
jgi:hypothetical protein